MSELTQRLCENLEKVVHQHHRIGKRMHNKGRKQDAFAQKKVLELLTQNQEELTISRLVELLDIRPSSVSELVKKLEDGGYVVREKDEKDKRVMKIMLTKAGKEMSQEKKSRANEWTEFYFSELTNEEQKELNRLLEKVSTQSKEKITTWMEQHGINNVEYKLDDEHRKAKHHNHKRVHKGKKHN